MRAKLGVNTLLKTVLLVVAVLLVLEIVRELFGTVSALLGPLPDVIGLLILLVLVLWLLDRV